MIPGSTIPFKRSAYDPSTGAPSTTSRTAVNLSTSFVDASVVYGSTNEVAAALRSGRRRQEQRGDRRGRRGA
jgi:hypothetical protein